MNIVVASIEDASRSVEICIEGREVVLAAVERGRVVAISGEIHLQRPSLIDAERDRSILYGPLCW